MIETSAFAGAGDRTEPAREAGANSTPFAVLLGFVALHTAIWTTYGELSNSGALHPDMLEAYNWGRQFQLGYYKHPPLWAWIAGIWFQIFPPMNWSFYLLAALNSAIAIIGVWRLAGLFTQGNYRLAATLLLFATPFYTFSALRYNANAMLLSLWPWTVYFFVKSIETISLRAAFFFGVLAAGSLLSKYYSAILLASCVLASFLHPNWKRYYLSPAPYLSVFTCAALASPHLAWLISNNFPSVHYAKTRSLYPSSTIYQSILSFILGCAGFNAVVAALVLGSRYWGRSDSPIIEHDRTRFVAALALAPFALTVLAGVLLGVRLSTNFALPVFFLFPLLLIHFVRPKPEPVRLFSAAFAIAIAVLALPIALSVPYLMTRLHKNLSVIPSLEIAREATRIWHEATATPLRIVAGSWPYALVTAYYSGDETTEYTNFSPRSAPWVTAQSLAQYGMLAICVRTDEACNNAARDYATPNTRIEEISVARQSQGFTMRPETFRLYIIPAK